MRGTPPIQRRPITDALRASIVEDLPEINDIKDAELRAKVIEGWAFSLAGSSFKRISDLPGEGNPDVLVLKRGNQTDHLRGVAHFAMKFVEEFESSHPEISIDRDIVLAGALCHDIGKPYEFDPVNRKRWAEDPSRAGRSLPAPFGLRRACLPLGRAARGDRAYRARPFARGPAHRAFHRVLHRAPRRSHLVARRGRARPAQARDAGQCRLDDAAARSRRPGKAAKVA